MSLSVVGEPGSLKAVPRPSRRPSISSTSRSRPNRGVRDAGRAGGCVAAASMAGSGASALLLVGIASEDGTLPF